MSTLLFSDFPEPDSSPVDLLIVAGEHSGDQHAARLLLGLKQLRPDLTVAAVGGSELKREGAQLLFDLTQHSVVGIVEVVSRFGLYKKIFDATIDWIEKYRPRHVCLVDYPGFNLRLARKLKKRRLSRKGGGEIHVFYYIGPQIWAWKAKRRFAMARCLDGLGVIFPFEVDCYKDTELRVRFVGHPFVSMSELPLKFEFDGPVLLLPGSRKIAVSRIFPILLEAFMRLRSQYPDLHALVIYPDDEIRKVIEEILADLNIENLRIRLARAGAQSSGRAALVSSGTMSLACGLAGIPGCIIYRTHPVTFLLGRMLTKLPYLGIVNLLLNSEIYPEYIQVRATAKNLERGLHQALFSDVSRKNTRESSSKIWEHLKTSENSSSSVWLHELMEGEEYRAINKS